MKISPEQDAVILSMIADALSTKGIILNDTRPQPFGSQGFMSKVFSLDSNKGKLILHLSELHREQRRQKIWEKVDLLSTLLGDFPQIPTAQVLCSGVVGKKYYIVQNMLRGQPAGARTLKHGLFVDVRQHWSKDIEREVEQIVARINQIPLNGYGWIVRREKTAGGRYKTWQAFLAHEFALWTKGIARAEGNAALTKKLKRYFAEVFSGLTLEHPSLVHGDLTNPSNILVLDGKVSGLVDWEWSLAGDPAWEFAFHNPYSLNAYFKALGRGISDEEKREFKRRISIYGRLYLIWAMYIHTKSDVFYRPLRRHLIHLGF